ncbi:DNA primase family protein [Salinibacter ruber]|uniref:DNA primase family protein n=1 Tax=Salinibacter ruber TaxID=146919 RepID=UPI002167332E|nr:phage/plasmid primase, P4 family [Salinibacter ruber]MCS3782683.1 P4 family phage/plasmid primase-like protein [Salinibacter ruber]
MSTDQTDDERETENLSTEPDTEKSETDSDETTESSGTDSEDKKDYWPRVRSLYDANRGDEARLYAAAQAKDELQLATDQSSKRIFAYDEEKKILRPNGEQKIRELLVRKLGKHHSTYQVREIKAKVKALTFQDDFGGEFIPVANGDLFVDPSDPKDSELKDCDPDRAPLSRSEAKLNGQAGCPYFRNHLRDVLPNEKERQTLQEYAGYCLYHWDIPFHKALFAFGPTASGKSTTLRALRKILGDVSSLSPQQMVNGRFGAAELEGSWANIRSDLSSELVENVGLFKEIVGGDEIYIERKHEQGYKIRPTAKHIYAANQLPEASTDDDAFYRRVLLISFPETIPKEERENRSVLDRRLEDERDGILRWAVKGLLRLLHDNGFTHDRSPKETRRRWEEYTSSVGQFKASSMEVTGDTDDVVSKDEAYIAYSKFCKQQGLSTESKQELTRILKRDPQITDKHRTPVPGEGQTRCYVGVRIN